MNELWLLESGTLEAMQTAQARGISPTSAEISAHEATFAVNEDGMPRIMSVAGDRANISVNGILTDSPNFMARFFGGGNATYSDIRTSLALAEADPAIKETTLSINSPGGQASAEWIETLDAIANAKKPVHAFVGNMAASAAFGIASQADTIEAQNRFSRFGSIGVIRTSIKDDDRITTTSSNAPKKNPDASTESGATAVREEIDKMEKIFIDAVADGRSVSTDTVKKDFGQGGVLLAEEALKNNMIDSIAGNAGASVHNTAATSGKQTTEAIMDLNKLKAEHSAVYAAAVQDGVSKERDRVEAHLTMGQASGDMKTAIAAVESGDELTAKYNAKYMAASMNRSDVSARGADDTAAAAALDGAAASTDDDTDSYDADVNAKLELELGETD